MNVEPDLPVVVGSGPPAPGAAAMAGCAGRAFPAPGWMLVAEPGPGAAAGLRRCVCSRPQPTVVIRKAAKMRRKGWAPVCDAISAPMGTVSAPKEPTMAASGSLSVSVL